MGILKKPYEISIWEDSLVRIIKRYNNENGIKGDYIDTVIVPTYEDFDNFEGYITEIDGQYYDEKKLAVIGSNTMTAPFRATKPELTQNVNGSISLSFILYSKYYDDDTGNLLDNPFTKLMVNERKIKLKYDGEWYDFVIKSIQENSEQFSYTYTAKSLFVNELSKTGFELEFDTELENNLGTIDYLAEQILDGSDWRLKQGETFQQYKEEPLYEIILATSITGTKMYSGEEGAEKVTIAAGSKIFGFYQSVNEPNGYFQFLYREDGLYTIDDDRVITNSPNYYYEYAPSGNENLPFISDSAISNEYRGRRLVRSVETDYDPILDKYVAVYKDSAGNKIYGYSEFEYLTTESVRNYVVNPTAFTNTDGWKPATTKSSGDTTYPDITIITDPPVSEIEKIDVDFKSYLCADMNNGQVLINTCISENRSLISEFIKDEVYVFRIKDGYLDKDGKIYPLSADFLDVSISEYSINNGILSTVGEPYFNFIDYLLDGEGYRVYKAKCLTSLTYSEMLDKRIGLILVAPASKKYCIYEAQFFQYRESSDGTMILPGEVINAETKTKYRYYLAGQDVKSADEIAYLYEGYEPSNEFESIYSKNFEKRRSISAKESNRFNLLQTLCETFECWIKFTIEHDETGKILLDENYRQKKWVSFHEYVGKENFTGFKYGINLKSIQRTLDSDAIANKLIVKNNSNEFAEGGFCSISTASENPIKENFIFDLSYYINQGLISFNEFNNDLYLDVGGYLGYYKKLREWNKEVEKNAQSQAKLVSEVIPHLKSQFTTYDVAYNNAQEVYTSSIIELERTTGLTIDYLLSHKENNWWEDDDINALILDILHQKKKMEEYGKLRETAQSGLKQEEDNLQELKDKIQDLIEKKKDLNAKFYQKYSRFIQEGSWISEDYIDPNLYYLDAESTLHTSAQPKVSYTINVIEISQIEGYELYQFKIGDKTTMEDTKFFGWTYIDGTRTPYKEEVIISETKISLDDPSQNQIKVQNYKTRFEDLFQRITATTNAVQYSTGEYQRAAGVVQTDGSIEPSAIQNSLANNSVILSNSNNESVVMGPEGIVTTSLARPNEMVRIVGGGIFLSNDFGSTWNTGITGNGINANYITAGQIDTNLVRVMSGNFPTFRWDSAGISAYKFELDESGKPTAYSQSQFIRLDQFGLYGIDSDYAFNALVPEKDSEGKEIVGEKKIQKHSHFYLTWTGFGIKTDNGSVSITSGDDIQVFDTNNTTRIKIGKFDVKTDDNGNTIPEFGMRLMDESGETTLETGDSGQLYLKKTIKIAPNKYALSARTIIGPSQGYDKDGNKLDSLDNSNLAYSKIFSVNSIGGTETIAFYDNGLLEARNAKISGILEAGSIISDEAQIGGEGGLTIGNLQNGFRENSAAISTMKGIKIISDKGTTFVEDAQGAVAPTSITFNVRDNGVIIEAGNEEKVVWYLAGDLSGAAVESNKIGSGLSVNVTYDEVAKKLQNRQCYILAIYTHTDGTEYSAFQEINLQKDGVPGKDGTNGADGITYRIDSSNGFVFNSSDTSAPTTTTLTARIFRGIEELDPDGKWTYTWYDKTNHESNFEGAISTGKQITYDLTKFSDFAQIYFTASDGT